MADETSLIPEGYYAVPDPADPGTMVYARRPEKRDGLLPWPAKARFGPVLLRRDVPAGLDSSERYAWARAWFERVRWPWEAALRAAVAADVVGAGRRFAELTTRCCQCGRPLTDPESKCYGIGPDCRGGIPGAVLAAYFTPQVAKAHAAALDQAGGAR